MSGRGRSPVLRRLRRTSRPAHGTRAPCRPVRLLPDRLPELLERHHRGEPGCIPFALAAAPKKTTRQAPEGGGGGRCGHRVRAGDGSPATLDSPAHRPPPPTAPSKESRRHRAEAAAAASCRGSATDPDLADGTDRAADVPARSGGRACPRVRGPRPRPRLAACQPRPGATRPRHGRGLDGGSRGGRLHPRELVRPRRAGDRRRGRGHVTGAGRSGGSDAEPDQEAEAQAHAQADRQTAGDAPTDREKPKPTHRPTPKPTRQPTPKPPPLVAFLSCSVSDLTVACTRRRLAQRCALHVEVR